MDEKKNIYVTAEMPKTLEKQARIAAAQLGVSRSEVIRLALNEWLKSAVKELAHVEARKSR